MIMSEKERPQMASQLLNSAQKEMAMKWLFAGFV
jgi:hypothetical protein